MTEITKPNKYHNRPEAAPQKLAPKQAKHAHRKHGRVIDFDSTCLAEAKIFKKGGGTLLTFTDGSQYMTDLTKADVKDLRDAESTGELWNKVYRE